MNRRAPGALKWWRPGTSTNAPLRQERREALRVVEDAVLSAGGDQHGLLGRIPHVGVLVAEPHAAGERDERVQVVVRHPLREADIVLRRGIGDGRSVVDVRPRLLEIEAAERPTVRDPAEHRTLDAQRPLGGEVPPDAGTERVSEVENRIDHVRIKDRLDVRDERRHRVVLSLVRLLALAVPALVDAEHTESCADERRHPPGADPVVATARREAVYRQHDGRVLIAPCVRRDAESLLRHHVLRLR